MANNSYGEAKGNHGVDLVRISDIDTSVKDYFEKKLNLKVDSNTGRKSVPVIFATGEECIACSDMQPSPV